MFHWRLARVVYSGLLIFFHTVAWLQVQHQYCLTDEQGPAHRKVFFVKLKLGDEEFDASGASIKKAQHAAAATALESTKLPRPPPKRLSTNAAVPISSLCLLLLLADRTALCLHHNYRCHNNNNNNLICIAPVCAKKTSVAHHLNV